MPEGDPLFDMRDPARAMMLLTRLPVTGADGDRAAASVWAWPLVGALIGLGACVLAWGAMALGLPVAAAAGLAIAFGMVATGGLHEDGLADCADGFWGAQDSARRLDIMKDSRVGTFGVLALVMAVGLKWVLLTALLDAGAIWAALIGPAALSRAAMGAAMVRLPFARDDGFARHVGRPTLLPVAVGGAIAVGLLALLAGASPAMAALLAAAIVVAGVTRLTMVKIGGQTGDVLGATQVLTEIAALAALSVLVL
jgi:adenosylcobinamide-GDP ribazoletransferase